MFSIRTNDVFIPNFYHYFFLPSGLTSSNSRALHVDGAQKTDYVLTHLRQSRNSELCLTQSQYTDTGPTSRTQRSWVKCNGGQGRII